MRSVLKIAIGFIIGAITATILFSYTFRAEIVGEAHFDAYFSNSEDEEHARSALKDKNYIEATILFERVARSRTDYLSAFAYDQFLTNGQLVFLYEASGEKKKSEEAFKRANSASLLAFEEQFASKEGMLNYLSTIPVIDQIK